MHIYWFQDSKIGHLNQVQALLNEMEKEMKFSISLIPCEDKNIFNWLKRANTFLFETKYKKEFILLMGAGHATYPAMLQAQKTLKKTNKTLSIAILKPSLNSRSFDLVCAPEHDFTETKKANNIITFKGSLASTSFSKPILEKGIIAIGGKSKHYKFDVEIAQKQIVYILTMHPNHYFKIFNSRRTPELLNKKIKDLLYEYTNFKFIDLNDPHANSFKKELQISGIKFVTPDSSNLVFEALSSKGKTYLMQIENPKYNRWLGTKKIRKAMDSLVKSKQAGVVNVVPKSNDLHIHNIEHPSPHFEPFAEAEMIACSIINLLKKQI